MATSSNATPAPAPPPKFRDVAWTYSCGLGVMVTTAPLIHPFNVVAAAAAKTQSTSGKAAAATYKGLGGNPPNTFANYYSGLTGHLSKELVRSWGRIGGVIYVEPYFKERFSPGWAPHMLAGVMATYEVIFANPADVWKSYRSTGLPTRTEDLFKGSVGNFWRQYMMWFAWSKSIPYINSWQEGMGMDPKSFVGIGVRSVMQSAICTACTYPTELGLRTVQVRSAELPVKNFGNSLKFYARCLTNPSLIATEGAYFMVFSQLIKKNGIKGLGLGMTSKFTGNAILLAGANYLPMITAWAKGKVGE